QHLLFAVVKDLRANGVGVIYISHRLEEIFQLADRVTVLRDGESVGTREVGARVCDPQQQPIAKQTQENLEAQSDAASCGSQSRAPELTEALLIKLMVGREVSHIYPPSESA